MTAFFTALRFAGWTGALLPVQMILVGLNLPLAKRLPSGLQVTLLTMSVWPCSVPSNWPLATANHTFTVLS